MQPLCRIGCLTQMWGSDYSCQGADPAQEVLLILSAAHAVFDALVQVLTSEARERAFVQGHALLGGIDTFVGQIDMWLCPWHS